jgi:hypothetical protein
MSTSELSESEIEALGKSNLDRSKPFAIRNVMMTQMSIARHYGAITYNGTLYVYYPETDELIRDDVCKWLKKHREATAGKPGKKPGPTVSQPMMF